MSISLSSSNEDLMVYKEVTKYWIEFHFYSIPTWQHPILSSLLLRGIVSKKYILCYIVYTEIRIHRITLPHVFTFSGIWYNSRLGTMLVVYFNSQYIASLWMFKMSSLHSLGIELSIHYLRRRRSWIIYSLKRYWTNCLGSCNNSENL
jgi:hypothetical protein